VRGFTHLVHYRERLDALMATPPSFPTDFAPDTSQARAVVRRAVEDGRTWLDPLETADVMGCYGVPIASVSHARTAAEAVEIARPLLATGAVALKILSPDIVHKSDVGGVQLNLGNENAVREAAETILKRARAVKPKARIAGLTVHPMIVRFHARELIAGIASDATFGPIIAFGSGGTAVEVIDDKALALPPLDLALARDLISRTRASRVLKSYRNVPAADTDAIALVLVKLSQLAADVPEIRELDLNPLLADDKGVIVLDGRIAVAPAPIGWRGHPRFSIRPYPKEWERHTHARDGTQLLVRPVRPEDEPLYTPFLEKITPEDLRLRFFSPVKSFTHAFIARFTQIDYARAMAFVIIHEATGEMLGVGRLHTLTHSDTAEFGVLVRSDLKNQGLGWLLMQTLMEYACGEGIREIVGEVLTDNSTMLQMCAELGFSITENSDDEKIRLVRLRLAPPKTSGPMPP
jgi:acetyltransferase